MITVVHSVRSWLPRTMTWLYTQVTRLPDGITSQVVCEQTENLDEFPLQGVHPMPQAGVFTRLLDRRWRKWEKARYQRHLADELANIRPALVHSHFGNVGWQNLKAVRAAGAPHVVTFYGFDVDFLPRHNPRWRARYRDMFSDVALVLCEGSHMASCVKKLGCPSERLQVHHLGIRLDDIPYRPRQWDGKGRFKVLIAASFKEKKGIPYALEALGRVRKTVPLEVTVIGDASVEKSSRREKARILETATRAGLDDAITWLGYQPHARMFEEAYRHHLFLSPSVMAEDGDTEGGAPVSIIEMAASGMPVVSTTHCDIPEVIISGTTGLLAEERDVDGLATHILWLVENPDKWSAMLDAGREHIEKNYDAQVQGNTLGRIYQKLLEGGGGGSR